MPLLRDLIADLDVVSSSGPSDVEISRVVTDSRAVERGDLFVCLPGYRTAGGETRADRHDFLPQAVQRGAAAVVVEREVDLPDAATVIRVPDCWVAAADLACRVAGDPSRKLTVVGVTGTSGKTSTTYFVESVLRAAGRKVARIGTIEYRIGDAVVPALQTTPDAPVLQGLLRDAVACGCTAAVMEVSSHALELRRVRGIAFDGAVFTNLSQDHLNFHRDMHDYLHAKGRLFEELGGAGKSATAVVNVDDPGSEYIRGVNRGTLLTYGVRCAAQVRARDVSVDWSGARFRVETPAGTARVRLRHLGEYSVYNALAAIAVGCALGIDLDVITKGVAATPPVPGRFELIDEGQDFLVAVDYAHKPDALKHLLESARHLGPRRLLTVFGCGGDRDRGKRPVMGRIAIEGSDHVFVTSDNPRSEDPRKIVEEILAGVEAADPRGRRHTVEVDRAAAIRAAVAMAGARDMVVVAGKGHEPYQLVAGRRLDFDDREHVRAALRAGQGPSEEGNL